MSEALATKTDVKAQARRRVTDAKQRVADQREQIIAKATGVTPERAQATGRRAVATVNTPMSLATGLLAGVLAKKLREYEDPLLDASIPLPALGR